ncbi:MAG: sugar phosphate nucleotidyltransferase [Erysipelotrichaceae bacterium]
MRKEPMLVVLAAGMGSRYGGLKQIDPIGPHGEVILNYTCYDAYKAGFKRFVFIIKEEMHDDFKTMVGDKLPKDCEVRYVFQNIKDVPASIKVLAQRTKPLGTTHAMYCTRDVVDAPYAILNADDFYGADGFVQLYDFLTHNTDPAQHCMIGYRLDKTLTEHGGVTRGLCHVNDGQLQAIEEVSGLQKKEGKVGYQKEDTWVDVDAAMSVSMNMWGFKPAMMDMTLARFEADLQSKLDANPEKGEVLIPVFVGELLQEGQINVTVLQSKDTWFGVTYQEDKPFVQQSIRDLIAQGAYPEVLF